MNIGNKRENGYRFLYHMCKNIYFNNFSLTNYTFCRIVNYDAIRVWSEKVSRYNTISMNYFTSSARAGSSKGAVSSFPGWFRADSGMNLIKQGEFVTGRPCGSVAQWLECSHGVREVMGSSPGRAMCFFLPCDISKRRKSEIVRIKKFKSKVNKDNRVNVNKKSLKSR